LVQAEAVEVTPQQVLLAQVILEAQVEMAEAAEAALVTQVRLALVVLVFFIYTTKEINNGNIRSNEWQYSFKCNCRRR
jgi:hypothetical protein